MANVSLLMAFTGGFLSFFSPCVVPLVPSYLSFITGISYEELTGTQNRRMVQIVTIKNSLAFIAGFSLIFILLGASSSFIGSLLSRHHDTLRKIGGLLIVVLGLYIAGALKLEYLSREKRVHLRNKPAGLFGSLLVGTAFAAGWTPCIGPVLGSILMYAGTAGSVVSGIALLAAYALGLGIPFLLTAIGINSAISFFRKTHRFIRMANIACGVVLTAAGMMLFTGTLDVISRYISMS